MLRKTALLTGVAGALLFAAPALAQDPTAPAQGPMTQTEPQTQSVAPGAQVKGSDGAELGVLEGAGRDAAGQQTLQIRAETGELKAAPVAGASVQDGAVVIAWSEAEFAAAPSVMDNTADASATATEAAPVEETTPTEDALPETQPAPEPPMTTPPVTETAPIEEAVPPAETMPEAQTAPEAPVTAVPPVDEDLPADADATDDGGEEPIPPADPMA